MFSIFVPSNCCFLSFLIIGILNIVGFEINQLLNYQFFIGNTHFGNRYHTGNCLSEMVKSRLNMIKKICHSCDYFHTYQKIYFSSTNLRLCLVSSCEGWQLAVKPGYTKMETGILKILSFTSDKPKVMTKCVRASL